ncbi:MAG: Rid family detoxifying hydrolase [Coriobacteriia bacterium]|nr:Rid family detoxifying hydrolase [Coriobacteriia bacterium]MCL2870995.1 Rid family detoxifying hydrolase [Coriobacteriia bacterium]
MKKEIINSEKAFAAVGPYSHSVLVDGSLQFISGQIGADPSTGKLKATVEDQTIQAFANLEAILEETGMSFENVVKTTVFLKDMDDFAAVNQIYAQYFPHDPPARSCVAAAALPLGALFEVEAIAVK